MLRTLYETLRWNLKQHSWRRRRRRLLRLRYPAYYVALHGNDLN